MAEKLFRKIMELLPEVNKEIWDLEDEESLNWIRTFKDKESMIKKLCISDSDLTKIFHEEDGWLEDPIIGAPDITTRMVMEAVFTECVLRAGKELGFSAS